MQLKKNKKEEAEMSKSIKVKKICNGNKESKDVLSQYLRIKELENKWENGHIRNWSMVLNQLMIDDHFTTRINQYLSSQS